MDKVSPEERSRVMARVKSENTKPEKTVRSLLHKNGFRFRLHRSDLPGTPDIVLPKLKTVIFVHGCFWHRHPGCKKASTPVSNADYWNRKFAGNQARDAQNVAKLQEAGWRPIIVWECELRDLCALEKRLTSLLRRRV
ncbi:MAG: DNA mismatch endonuclease Vsr [Deltaproteobacteria bacterium]|jgi:DNA mismatch endonuclease (patch repair protein)|nr:DNA mismatch endonuclease Vsr [Deltaproteobacteria bacterium]